MISDYLRLIRIENCFISFFAVIIGVVIASSSITQVLYIKVVIAAVVVFLITGAGNTLNDYFDYKIDKINNPSRPIPSGKIKRKRALYFAILLFAIGILFSIFLNPVSLGLVIFNSILLVIYGKYSKRLFIMSNIIVAYLTASIFIFSSLVINKINLTIILLGILAFFIMLSREILKDMEDVNGDKRANAITLPIKIGIKNSKILAFIIIIIAVLLSPIPFLIKLLNEYFLFLILLTDVLLIYSFSLDIHRTQKMVKFGSLIILVAFLIGVF